MSSKDAMVTKYVTNPESGYFTLEAKLRIGQLVTAGLDLDLARELTIKDMEKEGLTPWELE